MIAITSMDEKFLQKVLALVEEHMEDENFSIEDFSREAGYSRMEFYRKIKALAGQTPSQFVRTIRLKRAAQMLFKKSDKVSQIAYRVGFEGLAYFNKCFKEQFGVTPRAIFGWKCSIQHQRFNKYLSVNLIQNTN
jgi:AraC-like DNA-binding protein